MSQYIYVIYIFIFKLMSRYSKHNKIKSEEQVKNKHEENFNKILDKMFNQLTNQLILCLRGIDLNDMKLLLLKDWRQLKVLDLHGNQLCFKAIKWLSLGSWENLTYLDLGRNKLNKRAIQNLKLNQWINLKTLKLYDNQLGDEGLKSLLKINFSKIRHLNIKDYNKIGSRGLSLLSFSNFISLRDFQINYNKFSALEIIQAIATSRWEEIELVEIQSNQARNLNKSMEPLLQSVLHQSCTVVLQ